MRRPQNMLEWSDGLADRTKHHIQVSGRSSDQSIQLRHLSHLDSRRWSRSQKNTTLFCCGLYEKVVILCWNYTDASFKSWFYHLIGPIWYIETFVCLNFNRQYLLYLYAYCFSLIILVLDYVLPITVARGLRHELSSPAQTLGSWVRIPLKAWMSVCLYSVFVLSCVQVAALRLADPPSKESYRLWKRSRNWKTDQGSTKDCR
jgi:hypothetical protein